MNAEIQLLSLRDTESQKNGRSVIATFRLHPEDAENLRGLTGARFGAALVKIGDDEKPPPTPQNRRIMQSAALCDNRLFQNFLSEFCSDIWQGAPGPNANEKAAQVLRAVTGVESRKEWATNPEAAAKYDRLTTQFELWKLGE